MTPTPRLIGALATASTLAVLLVLAQGILPGEPSLGVASKAWWLGLIALGVLAGFDALRRDAAGALAVERSTPRSFALGEEATVRLAVRNEGERPLRVELTDHAPAALERRDPPAIFALPAKGEVELRYRVLPIERGDARFEASAVRVESRLRLWTFQLRRGQAETVRVYPNFPAIARLEGLDLDRQARQVGVHPRARRGAGTDFLQLREFRDGDTLRQIDWKATARHRRPIARQYGEERDQQIVFALDCGRRLRAKDGLIGDFDHALNAMLLCAYVALSQGDAVGVLSFGERERWLPPRKGRASLNGLLRQLYDLQATTAATDFAAIAEGLLQRHARRSLVVLISSLREEDAEDLLLAVRALRRRHRVVVASLREHLLGELLEAPIRDFDDALRHAGATERLGGRERLRRRLAASDVRVVDAEPRRLHTALVREYLLLKRSGLL